MYHDIMSSRITKLVLVPLEEWKCLNKNRGDTYTTIEIPSFKKNPKEGRGKKEEQQQQEAIPPPPPPPPPRQGGKGQGEGRGKEGGGGQRGIEIIGNVGNRPPGIRVTKIRKEYGYFKYST